VPLDHGHACAENLFSQKQVEAVVHQVADYSLPKRLGQRWLSPEPAARHASFSGMKQTLAMAVDHHAQYEKYCEPARHDACLAKTQSLVPWAALCSAIEPHDRKAGTIVDATRLPGGVAGAPPVMEACYADGRSNKVRKSGHRS